MQSTYAKLDQISGDKMRWLQGIYTFERMKFKTFK